MLVLNGWFCEKPHQHEAVTGPNLALPIAMTSTCHSTWSSTLKDTAKSSFSDLGCGVFA